MTDSKRDAVLKRIKSASTKQSRAERARLARVGSVMDGFLAFLGEGVIFIGHMIAASFS